MYYLILNPFVFVQKMNSVPSLDIDEAIDRIVMKLSTTSCIQALFPNQRNMLHEFCREKNIFYTGNSGLNFLVLKCYIRCQM